MLAELSIKDFLAKTAGNEPVPGGGSVSALNAALSAALTEMVANLTIGKKKYEEKEDLMKKIKENVAKFQGEFVKDIDEDSNAYNKVFDAFKLPKETDEEKLERGRQIQAATKIAAEVPMKVARNAFSIMELIEMVAKEGNQNAVTDACVGMMAARNAILGAILNVRINLTSIKDETFVEKFTKDCDHLEKEAIKKEKELLDWVKTQL
jgi:formiminotetrahydrofolate cyclodeaminase